MTAEELINKYSIHLIEYYPTIAAGSLIINCDHAVAEEVIEEIKKKYEEIIAILKNKE